MYGSPRPARPWLALLILLTAVLQPFAVIAQSIDKPDVNLQVKPIRSITPDEFRESRKDLLSGGIPLGVPFRMATDSQGRILITDPPLSLVHVFDVESGLRSQLNGDRNQRMLYPTYIAVDANDNIYLSEPLLAAVLVFQPDGKFLRSIGGDHLFTPYGIVIDRSRQELYVADHYRDEIQVYTLDGQFLRSIGSRGKGPGELSDPSDIALHHGILFVLDSGNARFSFFDTRGVPKGVWAFGSDRIPATFALDSSGNLYMVDLRSLGMLVLDAAGNPLSAFDVRRPYGQPDQANRTPDVTSVAPGKGGSMLALRPSLRIDVIELGKQAPPAPPPQQPKQ
jgi:DNA-binding beta-propeller fold protein YncE